MTVARVPYASLLSLAVETDCIGVEVRNDLDGDLFDGSEFALAGEAARDQGLRLLALSEVSAFNDMSDRAYESVERLAVAAKDCGAEAIILIPRNDGRAGTEKERIKCLRESIVKFAPVLEKNNVLGFVEPLGFEQSSLRSKTEIVDVLEELDLTDRFKLVHDTFHHHLAGGGAVFPKHTGIVHVSGVVESNVPIEQLRDDHRVMVDGEDILYNIPQLHKLTANGYTGPVSVEVFSPQVHNLKNPKAALLDSFNYIESTLAEVIA